MRKDYLQRLESKSNLQIAMSLLLNTKYNKYTKVGFSTLQQQYTIYNYWLKVFVKVNVNEYNYISNKLVKTF